MKKTERRTVLKKLAGAVLTAAMALSLVMLPAGSAEAAADVEITNAAVTFQPGSLADGTAANYRITAGFTVPAVKWYVQVSDIDPRAVEMPAGGTLDAGRRYSLYIAIKPDGWNGGDASSYVNTIRFNGEPVSLSNNTGALGIPVTDAPLLASLSKKTGSSSASGQMIRFYNKNNGEHFYTCDPAEIENLEKVGWKNEGPAWNAPATSATPVYRLYNPNSGEHHYTTKPEEKDALSKLGWQDEGIKWYSNDSKTTPIYRLYNPNAKGKLEAGAHHYTKDPQEKASLISAGWKDEEIGWYGL